MRVSTFYFVYVALREILMLFSNMRETWFSSLNIVTLKCSVMHAAGYNALCDLPKIPLSSVDAAWRMIMNWNIQKQNLS